MAIEENIWLGRSTLVDKKLKAKINYNTKVNNRYFKRHRLQQWGSRRCGAIPILEDDLDIMERIDYFDTMV